MQDDTLNELAATFLGLFSQGQLIAEPKTPIQSLSLEDAYRVQAAVIQMRVSRGEKVVGYKVGCTSRAIREQFGLTEPICGRLMAPHFYHGDKQLSSSTLTNCAVEPEFAFRMGTDIRDAELDDAALLEAIDFVSPAVEVHNYRFWFGKPSSQELIASNGIHASVVVGDRQSKMSSIDLAKVELSLFVDDDLKASGFSNEIMGGPLVSLRWLTKHLVSRGDYLRAGQWVIPGSPVQLILAGSGNRVTATLSGIGSVNVDFL